jgi:hypothetical protein
MADPVVHITNGIPDSGTGNITTLGSVVSLFPPALGAGGGLKVDGSGTPVPVSGTVAVAGAVAISGTVPTSRAPIAPVVSTALESGHVLKASAGSLFSLQFSTTSTIGWMLLFDSATVPADGAVTPKKAWAVDQSSSSTYQWDTPLSFANGISIAFSTTGPFTKTASATAFFSGEVA